MTPPPAHPLRLSSVTEREKDLDFFTALSTLAYEQVSELEKSPDRPSLLLTRSFNGVESGSLPGGMTDDVDIEGEGELREERGTPREGDASEWSEYCDQILSQVGARL